MHQQQPTPVEAWLSVDVLTKNKIYHRSLGDVGMCRQTNTRMWSMI
jgi:hypothetical protein